MSNFKCGDWVRYKGIARIETITHTGYHLSNGYITKGDNGEMKLWKPQVDEWCWFYSDNMLSPHIMQFSCMGINGKGYLSGFAGYDYCEPFIGELPIFIKEIR